jgi:hypothetical protein
MSTAGPVPMMPVALTVAMPTGTFKAATTADVDGRYVLPGVPEGSVVATASLDSAAFLSGTATKTLIGDATVLTLDVNLHDLSRRLESLRRRQVELQLFAPSPGFLSWAGGAASREWVVQEVELARSGGLMEPMVVFHVADEVQRAMDLYPFRAGMLPNAAGGRPLDDLSSSRCSR